MMIFVSFIPAVWADHDEAPAGGQMLAAVPAGAGGTTTVAAKLDQASSGAVRLTLAPATPEAKATEVDLGEGVKLSLNGETAKVSELKSGDDLQLVNDPQGNTVEVKATRTKNAIVTDVLPTQINCTTDYLDKFSFPVTPDSKISAFRFSRSPSNFLNRSTRA
jgi:hypothetical protein